jgi:hypothetical protein
MLHQPIDDQVVKSAKAGVNLRFSRSFHSGVQPHLPGAIIPNAAH